MVTNGGRVLAAAIKSLLGAAHGRSHGVVPSIVGVVTLLIGATTVLVELQYDLDRIWDAPPRQEGFRTLLRSHAVSLGIVLGIGFLLLVSLAVSAALAAMGSVLSGILPGGAGLSPTRCGPTSCRNGEMHAGSRSRGSHCTSRWVTGRLMGASRFDFRSLELQENSLPAIFNGGKPCNFASQRGPPDADLLEHARDLSGHIVEGRRLPHGEAARPRQVDRNICLDPFRSRRHHDQMGREE